jgi:hypothetical protein
MFARICIMRALNRRGGRAGDPAPKGPQRGPRAVERAFDPSQKDKHRGRRKLARDR